MITGALILAAGAVIGYIARMLPEWEKPNLSESRWADEYFSRWQESRSNCPGCRLLEIKSDKLLHDIDSYKRIVNRLSHAAAKEWDEIAESLDG